MSSPKLFKQQNFNNFIHNNLYKLQLQPNYLNLGPAILVINIILIEHLLTNNYRQLTKEEANNPNQRQPRLPHHARTNLLSMTLYVTVPTPGIL